MRNCAYVDDAGMDPIYELQAEICRTLSHPARIAILHLLADEPREVGRLAELSATLESPDRVSVATTARR